MGFSKSKRIMAAFFGIIMLITLTTSIYAASDVSGIINSLSSETGDEIEMVEAPKCTCGDTAPENLAYHADSCPRKQFVKSLISNKTAKQIYADWSSYDSQLQTDILNMVEAYYPTSYDELLELVETSKGLTTVIINEFSELKKEYSSLTEDGCEEFYDKMMASYSKAFDNDETIVTGEQMQQIDEEFSALQDALYEDFGFTDLQQLPGIMTAAITDGDMSTMGDTGEIYSYKNVKQGVSGVSDYLLTLESYITGQTIDYVQPLDLILTLDQSASMYCPMGMSAGPGNSDVYKGSDPSLTRYAMDASTNSGLLTGTQDLKAAINSTEKDSAGQTFKEKLKQLGYLVAQSRAGGAEYCTNTTAGHKHTDKECKTYDWFVMQYVPDDVEGKPWHFHRIPHTACPSTDSWRNKTYVDRVVKYTDEQMGNSHFYFYLSQTGALYDSITAFAAAMKASGADHRLAVTGFSSGNSNSNGDNKNDPYGSGIYVNGTLIPYNTRRDYTDWYKNAKKLYNECTLTSEQCASALMSIQNNYDGVMASLNAVKTDYYQTYQNVGLDMCLRIIQNATKVETDLSDQVRKKVVVLFTDGEPSGPKAADIVAKAAEIKATGADIYTVCTSTLAADQRTFLTYSSSDYPNATATVGDDSTIVSGDPIANPQYAKTATSATSLVNEFLAIFNKVIADLGGANVQLTQITVLQDAISSDFTLPQPLIDKLKAGESVDDIIDKYIKVYTSPYNGTTFGEKVAYNGATVTIEKDSTGRYSIIKVTNFNYTENYITKEGRGENKDFFGNKLVVEIAIDPSETNNGGSYQGTNDEKNSGIYYENIKFTTFDSPHVDVPTTVTVTKYVVGKNADTNLLFDFHTKIIEPTDYQHSDDNGNHLKLDSEGVQTDFQLSNSRSKVFEDVIVGSDFYIYEAPNEDYNTKIKVYDINDKLISGAETLQADGSYKITVVPGMKIVYTNTVTNAGLTITKNYENLSDSAVADQSTLFKVVGADGRTIDIVIVGNDSVTINNLPVGEYTVTELQEWSWRYELDNVKTVVSDSSQKVTDGIKFVLTEEGEQVVFINASKEKKWLSGDSYCENIWKKKDEEEEEV